MNEVNFGRKVWRFWNGWVCGGLWQEIQFFSSKCVTFYVVYDIIKDKFLTAAISDQKL